MECNKQKGQIVLPVFYDVDPSTVRKQKHSYGEAFGKHEDRFKVQKWRAALEEAANLSGWDLPNTADAHEARVIKKIVKDIMARLGGQRHASNAENLVGMESHMNKVYKMLGVESGGVHVLHEVRDRSSKHGLEHLQEILLSEILVEKDLRINNSFEGANMLKQRLRMSSLNYDESLQLFKQHAFKKNHPTKEFADLSAQVIKHTGGLPLALKVLGSFLCGRSLAEWTSEVERFKQIPENEILKKLEPSFTGFHNIEQKLFLDIACFFSGKKKDSVTRILESFHFSPVIGIKVLMEKSLITILKGRIIMHQLIQKMGWHIVRREASYNPRIHSRLWTREHISPVLERNLGTEKIEGISLHLTNEEQVNVNPTAFMQMTSLRFLKFRNAYILGNMKYLNLSHSQKLIRTPDISGTPNLERLVLEECTSLMEIKFSVGDLGKLVLLNLKNCRNLKTLPKRIRLEKLEILILSGCSKLKAFPEI
ncbi:hypothetical protein P3S68_009102 [Capsicum galapagoense]